MYNCKVLLVIGIMLMVLSTTLASLNMELVDVLLNHDNHEYMRLGQAVYSEGRYEEALEYFFRFWQTQRDDENSLYFIALCYNHLNNPELAGKFLLEAKKRTITQFSKENTERNFSNVWDNATFRIYLNEVFDLIDQKNKERGYISYIETNIKVRYRTILPEGFDPEKEYPVMIYLHGFGGSPYNIFGLSEMFRSEEMIFVVPFAPYPWELSSQEFTSLSWNIFDYDEGEYNENHSSWLTMNYILKLNQTIREKYSVSQVFLGGFSQGGINSFSIGLTNQEAFDGLICFGGALMLPEGSIDRNGRIRVLIIHGENDTVIPFDSGIEAYQRLQFKGYDVEMYPYDGAHVMTRAIVQKAIDWMKGEMDN
ncbi:MAG: alpha/beta hydrolase-fold protein [Candidatus Cloacimonetes bacterium]|nr:alpha/beta hydrolase-fold protein [Candidatus Cloacimonadota bacterium]